MKRWKLGWMPVVGLMVIIFFLSHQPAGQSDGLSKGVAAQIQKVVSVVVPEKKIDIDRLNHYVRKNAHFFGYFAIGIFAYNAMRRNKHSEKSRILMVIGLAALFAVSDEFHQTFIEGRSGQWRDVLLDSAGAMLGVCGYKLVHERRNS